MKSSIAVDDGDRIVNSKWLIAAGFYTSRTAIDQAEKSGALPPSFKLNRSRKWTLRSVREHVAMLQAAAVAKRGGFDPLA